MGTRLLRRLHHPVLGALALVLAAGLWAVPAAAAPAQEPGVTLRVFDVQVPLTELCTLKPGQTPNVDKLMPTINWTTAADFGFERQLRRRRSLGNVNIADGRQLHLPAHQRRRLPAAASTTAIVIDHDGLHGADRRRTARSR